MKYTTKDKEFIEKLLNKCLIIKQKHLTYYVICNNVNRQLKYNNLYKENKKIKININNISFADIVLIQNLYSKSNYVNDNKISSYFESKYNIYDKFIITNNILNDILNLNNYNIQIFDATTKHKLTDALIQGYEIYIGRQKIY